LQHWKTFRSARDELRRGIPFVVVVLPHGGRLRIPNAPADFSDQVLAISRRLGLREMDATELIRDALERGQNPLQPDDTHFNEAGHWLMAEWLHERLPTTGEMAAQ
jgi:lysophospholipase L1-like esterase